MKNRNKHIIAFFIIALVTLLVGLALDRVNMIRFPNQSGYHLKLIQKDTGNWYYEIHYAGELRIHQEYVPGVPGNVNFATKKSAEKIGKLVLFKLQQRELPIVTKDELKKIRTTN